MKTYLFSAIFTVLMVISSCVEENNPIPDGTEKEFNLKGNAQKGPFINGSDVNVYELDKKFKPTGRSFYANTDEKGYFEVKGIKLVSPYVKIIVDGFYFNEVTGALSNEKMSLKAIVDLSADSTFNINVLTNLEFERVQYLIASNGSSIKEAKIQSQKELLAIFNMDSTEIENPESLDIIKSGEGDAALLAVSAILQANRTTADLSKLQADIILDMKTDGVLNDTMLQSSLISQASLLNLDRVRQNLIDKYGELGIILGNINDFDTYVEYFIKNSAFIYNSLFEFPESTVNGPNFLALGKNEFRSDGNYSFAVKMPDVGKMMVKITRTAGTGIWWYSFGQVYGWLVSQFDFSKYEQTFTSTLNGELIDLPFTFSENGGAKVEYYYNEALIASLTKTISWGGNNYTIFQFPDDPQAGQNLLAFSDSAQITSDSTYVIGLSSLEFYDIQFKIHYPATLSIDVKGGLGNYSYIQSTGQLEFNLKYDKGGQNPTDIILKFTGEGMIEIESNLRLSENSYLNKVFDIYN